jgi:hypothetical protein
MIICNNKRQFDQWVDDKITSLDNFMSSMTSKYRKDSDGKARGAIRGIIWKLGTSVVYGNFIITVKENGDTIIYNTRTRRRGEARLNLNDTMDYELGLALAWARYNHKEIPMIRTSIKVCNLKVGDVVNLGKNDNFIVLSIVPNIGDKDVAVTLMSWNGKRSSFYHNTANIVMKHRFALIDVVDHVNL